MIRLEENKGIPSGVLLMMAVVSGLTIGNIYYNQPLLELIRGEIGASEIETNMVTVISQAGYALGLCFIIPMGDLYSRRRIITVNMVAAGLMSLTIAFAESIGVIWCASLVLGASTVIPQLFIPVAGQFSKPGQKARNMGYVLSGLLTGILASRVVSGLIGDLLGWRAMYVIAAAVMAVCLFLIMRLMPDVKRNFTGTYSSLMKSVWNIAATQPHIRFNSIRSAFGFGSMLAFWSCLAFHIAGSPFNAGSDIVGLLGACGIAGALSASSLGKYVPRFGVMKFSVASALLQIVSWAVAYVYGYTYAGLAISIILNDIGLQCMQLSNQSDCISRMPSAANRVNTIFMTCYFSGGALGTFFAGIGWNALGWTGVCLVGTALSVVSLMVTLCLQRRFEGR